MKTKRYPLFLFCLSLLLMEPVVIAREISPLAVIDQTLCRMQLRYEAGKTTPNDAVYDGLSSLRNHHEALPHDTVNTPTRCKTAFSSARDPIHHEQFMGSLQKAASQHEVQRFLDNNLKKGFLLQPKVDGIAVELVYTHGLLTKASTRGDGYTGKNVLKQVLLAPAIPSRLVNQDKSTGYPKIILHGELFVMRDKKQGEHPAFHRERHWLAGMVARKNPDKASLEAIGFFPWSWVNSPHNKTGNDIKQLTAWGFTHINAHSHEVRCMKEVSCWYYQYQSAKKKRPC